MKIHNYLKEVRILKTPTTIKKEDFVNKYCSTFSENLTLRNITKNNDVTIGNISDYENVGHTVRYKINLSKFNNNYNLWFKKILSEANLPTSNIMIHASTKNLEPVSHKVHTDSDNSFGLSHDVICRFLIPLTEGHPTCYFDKCMEDNRFYSRFDKNTFSVIDNDNGTQMLNITKLYDIANGDSIEIDDNIPEYEHLSHIGTDSLKGLNVHKIGEWKPGDIHLFPCNVLHSSTDYTHGESKWMINGVIYVVNKKRK